MRKLVIRNFGPIKEVAIDLHKVNVFIGPQSSGKSTIAKIISFCTWIDKQREDDEIYKDAYKKLASYHRLSDYFTPDTEIEYRGANISYTYKGGKDAVENIHLAAKNPKVIYIPAERNFVSSVSNLSDYAEEKDNLQDFVKSWYDAKRRYTESTALDILNLGIKYYADEDGMRDSIRLESGKVINLTASSSGLQSVIPLVVLIHWLSKGIYKIEKPYSYNETNQLEEMLLSMATESEEFKELSRRVLNFLKGKIYTHTQFIVEEPEQNLFPEAQKDLLYYMMDSINHGKDHDLVITSHSPYILYALNNCMLGWKVKNQTTVSIPIINPEDVAIWEIRDGKVISIQGEDGLIRGNYFDRVMANIMADFKNLMNFYD